MMPYYVGIDGGGTKTAVELRTRCTQNAIDVVLGRIPENCAPAVPQPTAALCLAP